jgi:predicted nucleic-acid-binding Zn-ribbon protein
MQNQDCSKCGGKMDTGRVQGDSLVYYSNLQKKRFKLPVPVSTACACLDCGHIELYLDAEALNQRIRSNTSDEVR